MSKPYVKMVQFDTDKAGSQSRQNFPVEGKTESAVIAELEKKMPGHKVKVIKS